MKWMNELLFGNIIKIITDVLRKWDTVAPIYDIFMAFCVSTYLDDLGFSFSFNIWRRKKIFKKFKYDIWLCTFFLRGEK